MKFQKSLVKGIGINDIPNSANYRKPLSRWYEITRRTTVDPVNPRPQDRKYVGCTLHPDWIYASNFVEWITSWDNWESKSIDKDILFPGNKEYGPDKCLMVSNQVNTFFVTGNYNHDLPQGVAYADERYVRRGRPYRAILRFDTKQIFCGYHSTIEEAQESYKKNKIKCLQILIERESCPKVKAVLQNIYESQDSPSIPWW